MATVSFRKLQKSFGALSVVKGLDLEVADREFVVLVGPSGCGKSTTLRMLAGLEAISGGEIRIGDRVVNALPPRSRDIAMVFQDYALYPHKSVYDNMAFSLRVRGIGKAETRARIEEAAAMLDIGGLLDRKPAQLSGGQRQRVAMGRAIVRRPKVFLFDEPLSNLDAKLRGQVRAEIKKLHQMIGTTIIYVTHDQVEAMTLADRIVDPEGWRDRAGRHARRSLRHAGKPVRRRLRRLAGDELPQRAPGRRGAAGRRRRARAARRPRAPGRQARRRGDRRHPPGAFRLLIARPAPR